MKLPEVAVGVRSQLVVIMHLGGVLGLDAILMTEAEFWDSTPS